MNFEDLSWPWDEDRARITHTKVRLRMLRGCWEEDLSSFLQLVWSRGRSASQASAVDLSGNLVSSYARQMSQPGLYGTRPTIYGPNPEIIGLGGLLDRAMWPAHMQGVEYYARGAGCVAVVPQVAPDRINHPSGPISFRRVDPDRLYVECLGSRPLEPVRLWEQVKYHVPSSKGLPPALASSKGKIALCWDFFDISDPENPVYRVLSPDLEHDITAIVLAVPGAFPVPAGGYVGESYPWRYLSGEPYIPHTFYRERIADFWNVDFLRGAHRASFQAARLTSNALTVADSAAYGTGIAVNIRMGTSTALAPDGTTMTVIDPPPGSILVAETVDDQPAQLLQLAAAANPSEMMRVVGVFEERAVAALGLSQDQVTRDLANPTSAAALSIRDGTRRQGQLQAAGVFRSSDLEMLRKLTAMLTRAGVGDFADGIQGQPYSIQYHPIEIDGDAAGKKREDIAWRVEQGYMSKVEGYMALNEGADREAAIAALKQVAIDQALIDAADPEETEEPDDTEVRDRAAELDEELAGVEDALSAAEPDIEAAREGVAAARELLAEVDDDTSEDPADAADA